MSGLVVLFDGKCAFCIRSLRPIQQCDRRGNLMFVDANDPAAVGPYLSALGTADLSEAMFVIDGDDVHRGYFAFRRLMWNSPFTWPLIPFFYFPFASSFFGTRIYAWVARNRYRFGCASGSCSLPEASKLTGSAAR